MQTVVLLFPGSQLHFHFSLLCLLPVSWKAEAPQSQRSQDRWCSKVRTPKGRLRPQRREVTTTAKSFWLLIKRLVFETSNSFSAPRATSLTLAPACLPFPAHQGSSTLGCQKAHSSSLVVSGAEPHVTGNSRELRGKLSADRGAEVGKSCD